MTTQTVTRYAIKLVSPDGQISWHCQGLPKSNGFEFAILYPSPQHAQKAMLQWKFRTMADRLVAMGWVITYVPVTCTFEV